MNTYFRKSYIVFSTLIILMSSIVGILMPNDVSAAPKTLNDYAKSYVYYTAWEYCMETKKFVGGTFSDYIDPANAIAGRFFSDRAATARLGYVSPAPWDCNVEGEWLTAALRFWGWNDNVGALIAFGFTKDPEDGNYVVPSGFDIVTGMKMAIELKYYGARGRPQLTAAQKYVLYYNSFISGCEAKPVVELSKATADQKEIPNTDNGYSIMYLTATYSLIDMIYQGKGKGTSVDIASDTDPIKCVILADLIDVNSGAYQTYVSKNKSTEPIPMSTAELISSGGGPSDGTPPDGTTTCAIDGIGWIICPVVTSMSFVADKAFGFLADNFLVFDANFLIADSSNATFTAWQQMLVFANIGLVIFFILIIFSQITGFGISNYGIKKMLPKLIITVILMNLSFFIVQIAADLSNILGYSLKSFFGTISEQYNVLNVESFNTTNGIFSGIALTVLAGAGVGSAGGISGALVAFLPILLAGLIALIMIFFILIARQVLLILLTVLAPIAFLAYLLPNTEKWFTRWYKTLFALLMVFPIVGLVYGASDLASQVISSAMQDSLLGSAIGAAVITLPLFLVPIILKKSLDSIPALSGKINSLGSRFNSKATGSAKDRLGKSYVGQKAAYNRKQADIRRAQIQGGTYSGRFGRFNPRNLASGAFAGVNARSLSGRFGDQKAAAGAQMAQAQEEEGIKNAAALQAGLTSAQRLQLAQGEDAKDANGKVVVKASRAHTRASLREYGKYASADDAHKLMESVAGTTGADRLAYGSDLASALSANAGLKQSAPWIGGATYGSLTDETRTSADFEAEKLSTEALAAGKISASQVASMGAADIDGMRVKADDALTKATAALSSARTQDDIDKANAAIAQANTAKDVLRSIGVQILYDTQLQQQVPDNSTKAASIHDLTQIT